MILPFNGDYPITQIFGVNPQDYAQYGMNGHNGIDYGLPTGTAVLAAESGRASVLQDARDAKGNLTGFGNYIEIIGAHKTIYAHLQRATVPNGSQVQEGQQIGVSDNTGNSSGPHLHFGVKPIPQDNNNGYFGAVDPQPILEGGNEMSLLTLDIARVLAYNILGRNGYDGSQNALKGECDTDLKANHVGKETNQQVLEMYVSPEAAIWRDRRLAAAYADNGGGEFVKTEVYIKKGA